MENENEIIALIHLLDDNDNEVFRHVHEKLLSYGTAIIPTLEQAWHVEINPITHERLQELIKRIQFNAVEQKFDDWCRTEEQDLTTALYLVGLYFQSDLRFDVLQKSITKLRQSIWLELNNNQTVLEQIQIFNHVFYGFHGFKSLQSVNEFNDFCIQNVIEYKSGSAIVVGMLYQILAQELNLPVYGVALQHHYILAFCKQVILSFDEQVNLEREVMFYINPINNGSIFSRNEIKEYLQKSGIETKPSFFAPARNAHIVAELLKNIIEFAVQQKDTQTAQDFYDMLKKVMRKF